MKQNHTKGNVKQCSTKTNKNVNNIYFALVVLWLFVSTASSPSALPHRQKKRNDACLPHTCINPAIKLPRWPLRRWQRHKGLQRRAGLTTGRSSRSSRAWWLLQRVQGKLPMLGLLAAADGRAAADHVTLQL